MDKNSRREMSREKMDVILKGFVKHFFMENVVTSPIAMDCLYNGLKDLEVQTKNKKASPKLLDDKELPAPFVKVDRDMFVLVDDDVLLLLERAALPERAAPEPLPPKDDKALQNRIKVGLIPLSALLFILCTFPLESYLY